MPLRRPNRIVPKGLPAGLAHAGGRTRTLAEIAPSHGHDQTVQGAAAALPRDLVPYPFGPGVPLLPAPIDPVRGDTGRPEPRLYEYPVSWNLSTSGTGRLVPWKTLRDAANMPVIRDCLRIRKQEIAELEWEIGISKRAVGARQRGAGPGTSRHTAEADLRDKLLPEIERLTEFWTQPDPGQGLHFGAWIMQALEEHLVLDALAIYPRRTYGGNLHALEILDGSTVKPLLDHRGGRPQPPHPAYQQLLHGFARGEFMADVDTADDGADYVPGGYGSDQLIYVRREVRTWTPYGMSPVEMALLDLDTWSKRVGWMRAEYTDGVVPAGWLINKQAGSAAWTPSQVAEYEAALNDYYAGSTAQRRRVRVLPPGWEPDTSPEIGEKFRPDYDLHLLKLLVAHFDLTIHELGFTETQGLGSAGHSQGQADLNERKGSQPTLRWLASLLSTISRTHLGMPGELEFRWADLADDDADQDRLVVEQVQAGLLTLNEGRDELGRPRYAFAEADKPALISERTGAVTFLDGLEAQQNAAAQQMNETVRQDGAPAPADRPASESKTRTTPAAKAAEAAAYRRWAAKATSGRRFLLRALVDPDDLDAHGIDPSRVTYKAADQQQGGADDPGKGEGPSPERAAQWPGWAQDLAVAAAATTAILAALAGLRATVRALVRPWLAAQVPDVPTTPAGLRGAAVAHLAAHGVTPDAVEEAIRPAVQDLVDEATWVGRVAAQALVDEQLAGHAERTATDGAPVDWRGWTPGHPGRARELLAEQPPPADEPPPLKVDLVDVAQHQVDALAHTLADAVLDEHPDEVSPAAIEERLDQVLTDPALVERLAITVGTQSQGTEALRTYRRSGLAASTWLTADDTHVCPTCIVNEQHGPVPLGTPFPSGATEPPGHPRCRCCLLPSSARISPEQLDHHPTYTRQPGEHRDPPTARLEGR